MAATYPAALITDQRPWLRSRDQDRRSERHVAAELQGRLRRNAYAAMRHGLAEQPRLGRAVDAEDAAARPLGEFRVAARLDRIRGEVLVVVRDEARGRVEEAERRFHPGSPDRNL